ncbi:MAG: glycosyltransferase [Bacteroidetes bacterium]|nr:glycosyltransferase [Bacteroidota bacterium]
MKILLLTKKFPFPVKDGESLAIHNLSRAMRGLGARMDLLAMNTPKHPYKGKSPTKDLPIFDRIKLVDVDTRIKAFDAFRHLFKSDSYNVSRFDCPEYAEALKKMLKKSDYDVVQLETLYLAPYIPLIRQFSNAKVVMRAHNVEHEIWSRIADNTPASIRRLYIRHLTNRLERYETAQLPNYDLLAPITARDEARFREFGFKGPSVVTPIGIDLDDYEENLASYKRPLSLSFIGSLDWMPNLEGLKWFLDNIWKKARRSHPDLSLHVAGRNTPEWLHQLANKHLQIPGEVPDASTFINQHSVMIVPLLSGSGMRAKILEGMALSRLVITTSIGLEGIDARHKKEVLIADTPEQFLQAIDFCMKANPKKLMSIGQAARDLVDTKYANETIAGRLLAAFSKMEVDTIRL